MSPRKKQPSSDDRVEQLQRRAGVVRSRLFRAVDALDVRRHQIAELGRQTKRAAVPAALALLGVAVVVGIGAVLVTVTYAQRKRRSITYRLSERASTGATRALKRLESMGRPSLVRRVFDRVTLTLATLFASTVAKRLVKNAVDGRSPDGRLVVGRARERHRAGIIARVIPSNGATR